MNELNGDGSFLVRKGRKGWILSVKYQRDDNTFDVADYMIYRTEGNSGLWYLSDRDRQKFNTLAKLVNEYIEGRGVKKIETKIRTICKLLKPFDDLKLRQIFKIMGEINIWLIPIKELELGEKLGSGEFGEVFSGKLRGEEVAVKKLKQQKNVSDAQGLEKEKTAFERECENMKKLNNLNVVKIYGICVETQPSQLITEFCKNGSLKDYLEKFNNRENRSPRTNKALTERPDGCPDFKKLYEWCEQITRGMYYLEVENIIHCDLAARNVLLDKFMVVKIADFGLAKEANEDHVNAKIPQLWTAYEVLRRGKPSHKSDVWSLGITMWEIFSYGKTPYSEFDIWKKSKDKKKTSLDREKFLMMLNRGDRLGVPKQIFVDERYQEKIDNFHEQFMEPCWDKDTENRIRFVSLLDKYSTYDDDYLTDGYAQCIRDLSNNK